MRKLTSTIKSCESASSIYISIVIFMIIGTPSVVRGYENLIIFRATDDKANYAKYPGKYERVKLPEYIGVAEIYVERKPLLSIQMSEIRSLVIEREDIIISRSDRSRQRKSSSPSHQYTATFYLNGGGAKQLSNLTRKVKSSLIDLRFDNQRLGIGRIVEPLDGYQFTTGLEETNLEQLREIFAPLSNKVHWKQ